MHLVIVFKDLGRNTLIHVILNMLNVSVYLCVILLSRFEIRQTGTSALFLGGYTAVHRVGRRCLSWGANRGQGEGYWLG